MQGLLAGKQLEAIRAQDEVTMQAVSHGSPTLQAAGFSLIGSRPSSPHDWQISAIAKALRDVRAPPVRSAACKAAAHLLTGHHLDSAGWWLAVSSWTAVLGQSCIAIAPQTGAGCPALSLLFTDAVELLICMPIVLPAHPTGICCTNPLTNSLWGGCAFLIHASFVED